LTIAAPGPFLLQVLPPTVLCTQYVTDVGAFGKSSFVVTSSES
jgi:hypothetical protein